MTAEIEKLIARLDSLRLERLPIAAEAAIALRAMQEQMAKQSAIMDGWREDLTAFEGARRAAEAKLAEVEKSCAELAELYQRNYQRADAAEATVATLTAQVEAMRGALKPFGAVLKGNYANQSDDLQITAGHGQWDMRFMLTLGDFRRAAALTTENQTNG